MPTKALQPCAHPGCQSLVRRGYCSDHPKPKRDRSGDKFVRDPDTQKLYGRKWRKKRNAHISANPWCVECLKEDIWTPATDVDHIDPHRGDPEKFWNGELQSLCKSHHSKKTAREVGFVKR